MMKEIVPNVGDVIGRFQLAQELGRGPMSEVFLAYENETQWKAAIKIFILEPGAKPGDDALWAQRMVREATAAATFVHENVVRVHEVGQLAGVPFLVRDYIEGVPLNAYVGDRAPTTYGPRIHILREIARTLADIHRGGLVHRDVKPSNVLIRRDGAVRLLDFGVARRSIDREAGFTIPKSERAPVPSGVPASSERPPVLGTPAYMAPERFAQQGTSPVTDQFGWGVLAYELLAGRSPWGEGKRNLKPARVVKAILTESPPLLRHLAPEVAPKTEAVIARAMAKAPGARFPSMDYLVRDFEASVS
jgi:serine/threonine-protein kinase